MSEPTSQKPYLLRALYEWCVDNGFTPYISVVVDERTRVPMEYVRNGEIVLNIGPLAANRLRIGNDYVEFAARFGGVAKDLSVPIQAVSAIYARESGQGMAFEIERKSTPASEPRLVDAETQRDDVPRAPDLAAPPRVRNESPPPDDPKPPSTPRPTLRRVK